MQIDIYQQLLVIKYVHNKLPGPKGISHYLDLTKQIGKSLFLDDSCMGDHLLISYTTALNEESCGFVTLRRPKSLAAPRTKNIRNY